MASLTITAATIRDAAELAGATEFDTRRITLGLQPLRADRGRVLAALVEVGVDPDFLARLSTAPTTNDWVDRRPLDKR